MIRQVGERNDQFQRLVVWRLRVLNVIRAKQPGETKVFYFPDDLFPSRPGEAILPLDHDGERDHVPELLSVAFLTSLMGSSRYLLPKKSIPCYSILS
jgi:hypothetical protein